MTDAEMKFYMVAASFSGGIIGAIVGAVGKYVADSILQRDKEQFSAAHKVKEDIAARFMVAFDECERLERAGLERGTNKEDYDKAYKELELQYQRAQIYFEEEAVNQFMQMEILIIALRFYARTALSEFTSEEERADYHEKFKESQGAIYKRRREWSEAVRRELVPTPSRWKQLKRWNKKQFANAKKKLADRKKKKEKALPISG